ncbi:hypothetical protein [Kitasatospora purpeofusca]|uniref:hypothetical protein n=1 Tax=Kitasatospora purpeofusca TaxID=67352 RepID=UPI0035DA2165
MNKEQFADLRARPQGRATVSAAEIAGPDRTLALGQTPSRFAWHLYLENGWLNVLTFTLNGGGTLVEHRAGTVLATADLTPGKLLYPESTDERFARLVRERGYDLDFKPFDQRRYDRLAGDAFHDLVLDRGTNRLVRRHLPAADTTAEPTINEFAFKVVATAVLHLRAAGDKEARAVLDSLLRTPLLLDAHGGYRITDLVPADGWAADEARLAAPARSGPTNFGVPGPGTEGGPR